MPTSVTISLDRTKVSSDALLLAVLGSAVSEVTDAVLVIISGKLESRALTDILTTLAGVALFLAIVGVYGIVSYSTSRRVGEFGIRAALGADPGAIARLVLRQAGVLAAWGVAIGLLLALGIGQVLSTILYEMEAFDPLVF